MIEQIADKIVSKATSGKFILTVICGLVFAYCALKGLLSVEAITGIITMVFTAYFHKGGKDVVES